MGLSARQPCDGPGKQPRLRPHPPVVHAQRRQQRGAQRHVPIAPPFAPLDVNQHPPAVDVGDLQMAQLRVPHAGRVQDHQHRAVRQTVGGVDHPRHLLDTQDLGQPPRGFGIRRVVEQIPPLQRLHEEEAQRRHVEANGQRPHLPLAEQIRLIGPEVRLIQPVGPTLEVSSELLDRVEIRRDRGGSEVTALELLQHDAGDNGSQDTSCDPYATRPIERASRVASAAPAAWS